MREALTAKEVEMLLCFCDCGMKVKPAATMYGCDRKTLQRAFSKIFSETGFDPYEFWDLHAIVNKIEKEEVAHGCEAGEQDDRSSQ